MMITPEYIGLATLALSVWGFYFYITSVFKGQSKPHVFTWFIWGLISTIVFLAQFSEKAGPGAWAAGSASFFCLFIAALGLKYGEKNIARSDWIALSASLIAIMIWLVTKEPLWSVILASLIDAFAFWPTLRKSWHKPQDENLTSYFIGASSFVASLFAMQTYNLTTLLYPATVIFLNFSFIIGATLRRKQLIKL